MCYQTTCGVCAKPTWAGCGRHIEAALANVPEDERCVCRDAKPVVVAASTASHKVTTPLPASATNTASEAAEATEAGETIKVRVAFTGGLELLFQGQRQLSLVQPKGSTISSLITYLAAQITPQSRRNLFMQDNDEGMVRPGILVLINESDWELEGEGAYVIQGNDEILFVSTLHGG